MRLAVTDGVLGRRTLGWPGSHRGGPEQLDLTKMGDEVSHSPVWAARNSSCHASLSGGLPQRRGPILDQSQHVGEAESLHDSVLARGADSRWAGMAPVVAATTWLDI
jgi:hypothetical protein